MTRRKDGSSSKSLRRFDGYYNLLGWTEAATTKPYETAQKLIFVLFRALSRFLLLNFNAVMRVILHDRLFSLRSALP